MKHTITDVAPCRKRIEIELDADEVGKGFDEVYTELADSVPVKGFRRGHTPRRVLERKFGKTVGADVARHVFQKAIAEVLENEKISPMETPAFKPEAEALKPGQPFVHAVELDVRPVFDLPEYAGLELADDTPEPTDDQVAERIDRYALAFASYDPVEDGARKDDIIKGDITLTSGDKTLADEKDQNLRVEGERLLGLPCPDLEAKCAGAKAGDTLTFELTLPDDHPDASLRGQPATAVVAVKAVERPNPATIDDAFASMFRFESLDQMKDGIRRSLASEALQTRRANYEKQIIDQMIERSSFELPEAYLKRRAQMQLLQTRMRLAREGATPELLKEKAEELEADTRAATERGIRWSIISDAIAEKENFEITQEDVAEHVDRLARHYNMTPAKMLKQISDMDGMYALAAEIRDGRVMQLLIDKANKPAGAEDGHDHGHDHDHGENCSCGEH